jgi:hypothetical protein
MGRSYRKQLEIEKLPVGGPGYGRSAALRSGEADLCARGNPRRFTQIAPQDSVSEWPWPMINSGSSAVSPVWGLIDTTTRESNPRAYVLHCRRWLGREATWLLG